MRPRQIGAYWSEHESGGIRFVAMSRCRRQIRSDRRPPLIPDMVIDPMVVLSKKSSVAIRWCLSD
jgi:hypothetical protein